MNGCNSDCPICGGLGFVRTDAPWGDPQWGKIVLCSEVSGWFMFRHISGLADSERNMRFGVLRLDNDIRKAILDMKTMVDAGSGWLYLHGSYGTGKTTLLKTMVAEAINGRKEASYIRMTDMIENLRESYDEDNAHEVLRQRIAYYSEMPILCIDELDRVKNTDFVSEKQFAILDQRYSRAISEKKGVTVFASNNPPDMLDGYLKDRVKDGRFSIVELTGPSFRKLP